MLENSVAQAEYWLQSVLVVLEIAHLQAVLVAIADKRPLENAKDLLQNVLLSHQLLTFPIRLGQLDLERVRVASARFLTFGDEINEIG